MAENTSKLDFGKLKDRLKQTVKRSYEFGDRFVQGVYITEEMARVMSLKSMGWMEGDGKGDYKLTPEGRAAYEQHQNAQTLPDVSADDRIKIILMLSPAQYEALAEWAGTPGATAVKVALAEVVPGFRIEPINIQKRVEDNLAKLAAALTDKTD